jgi:hypothetical protein
MTCWLLLCVKHAMRYAYNYPGAKFSAVPGKLGIETD